jgi:hypothetical protein
MITGHSLRYYGYYSNVSRGKRKKEKSKEETERAGVGVDTAEF